MFLLDTNVLSAMMTAAPEAEVAAWTSQQPIETLFTASLCQAEILAGLAIMPEGRRRQELVEAARSMFAEDFDGRVLPFDGAAATVYAELYAVRRRGGRSTATVDLMIAAIAKTQVASIATRNVTDFEECGVPIINPWST